MADYGIKTSKKEVSVLNATGSDVLMTTKYPFAKIDQTKTDTFRTTTVTFLNDVANNTDVEIASFLHGYDYKPQLWGLWNVTWSPSLGGSEQNGYGALTNTSGTPSSTLWYEWDETTVRLYINKGWSVIVPTDTTGLTAALTTYVFADDLQEASYN